MNEWEPYAHRMSTLPFRMLPDACKLEEELSELKKKIRTNDA